MNYKIISLSSSSFRSRGGRGGEGRGGGGTVQSLIRGGSARGPNPYPFVYHF